MKKHVIILIALMTTCNFVFGQYDFVIEGIYYKITSPINHTVAVTSQNTSSPYNAEDTHIGSVIIPDSVTHEGNTYAVTAIGSRAFSSCNKLTSITIPNTVTTIENSAFSNCRTLAEVIIPNTVTSIGNYAFTECRILQSITIPNSVTTIGDYAFSYCVALSDINIPNSVVSIGIYTFTYCSELTSLTIPSSLTSIGLYAFAYCRSLLRFEVEEDNPAFSTVDNVLFSKNQDTLVQYPIAKTGPSYHIPNSVTVIEKGAFYYCLTLTSITIPSSVTYIDKAAFNTCGALTELHVEAVIPPTIASASVFLNVTKSIPVYVPCESVEVYNSTAMWNEFSNIQCEVGITEITTIPFEIYSRNNTIVIKQAEGQSVAIFDMMGRCVFQTIAAQETTCHLLVAGVYIVRIGEQFAKKVAV
jgi:hypothetical protein